MNTHERYGYSEDAERWAVTRANRERIPYGVLATGEVIPHFDSRWMQAVVCFEPGEVEL